MFVATITNLILSGYLRRLIDENSFNLIIYRILYITSDKSRENGNKFFSTTYEEQENLVFLMSA